MFLGCAAAAALLTAGAASAAPTVTISGPSATFGNASVTCPSNGVSCNFSDTITFTTPSGFNLQSATISTIESDNNLDTNINFGSVMLNGVSFTLSPTGAYESGFTLNQLVPSGGLNTLMVSGTVGGIGGSNPNAPANASYSGTISFATAAAVPELASWAMMILGMGAIGFALRREKVATRVSYAA